VDILHFGTSLYIKNLINLASTLVASKRGYDVAHIREAKELELVHDIF